MNQFTGITTGILTRIAAALFLLAALWLAAGCGGAGENGPAVPSPDTGPAEGNGTGDTDNANGKPETLPDDGQAEQAKEEAERELENTAIRALLEKGLEIRNLSYTVKFNSENNSFICEYSRLDNLVKMVTHEGESQSVSVSDGQSTVYYNLPEKTGFRMTGAGDDMGLVPNTEALLNREVYHFHIVGEESISGYSCQVVETEDEFGVLKIWISKTLGLPVKYIGNDNNGWYNLELTEIQLGEPEESIFVIPSDVELNPLPGGAGTDASPDTFPDTFPDVSPGTFPDAP